MSDTAERVLFGPTAPELREFAEQIARLYKQGDLRDLGIVGDGGFDEYSPDGNDDEVTALYNLIEDARKITGVLPADYVDADGLDQCIQCERWFKVGDPHFNDGDGCDKEG